jgi:hypothetical protein
MTYLAPVILAMAAASFGYAALMQAKPKLKAANFGACLFSSLLSIMVMVSQSSDAIVQHIR